MRRLLEHYRIMYSIWRSGLPASVRKAIRFVGREHLSYLKPVALMDLAAGIEGIEKSNVPGVIIETGCAMGGSSVVIASAKSTNRPFLVFDAFGLIPSPSDEDGQDVHERYNVIKSGKSKGIGGKVYYGYIEDLQETVKGNFAAAGYPVERNAIRLIKGLYQDTLQIAEPVAFAHIDCDWYDTDFP